MSFALLVSLALSGISDAPITPAMREGWQALLQSEAVFGNYSDAATDVGTINHARRLVYETVGKGEARIAARALWVGINLEYQAMLSRVAPVDRQNHAWRCQALGQRLREVLGKTPPRKLEKNSIGDATRWAEALLRLDAMEAESQRESPLTAPSLRIQVREVILSDFTPSSSTNAGGESPPNVLLMTEVGGAFRAAESLARKASAATVQASLALAQVYGQPPDQQRREIESANPRLLAESEVIGDKQGLGGLYPSGGEPWDNIVRLVKRTDGGGNPIGIVRHYAEARRVLGIEPETDLLREFAEPSDYSLVRKLFARYRLTESVTQLTPLTDRLLADVPAREKGGKFGYFTIDTTGKHSAGDIVAYQKWFDESYRGTDRAAGALAELEKELERDLDRGRKGSLVPFDEETVKHLVAVAKEALGRPEAESRKLVVSWLGDWVRAELGKSSSWKTAIGPTEAPKVERPGVSGRMQVPAPQSLRKKTINTQRANPDRFQAAESEEAGGDEPQKLGPEPVKKANSMGLVGDKEFLIVCIDTLEERRSLTSDQFTRLQKMSEGPDQRFKGVAKLVSAELNRLVPLETMRQSIRVEIKAQCTTERRIENLLSEGGEECIAKRRARLDEQQKKVDASLRIIAESFSLWGELKTRIVAASVKAVDILNGTNGKNGQRSVLSAQLGQLETDLKLVPRYKLTEKEQKLVRESLFPTNPKGKPVPLPLLPAGNTSAGKILAARQKLVAYQAVVEVLAGMVRSGPDKVKEKDEALKNFRKRYPPGIGETEYSKALDYLAQPNPRDGGPSK